MSAARTARRANAGMWSNARSFFLPVGCHIDPDGVRGYPIDMRVKADAPRREVPAWAHDPASLHVGIVQYGLGCWERWVAGEGAQWREAAMVVGRHLVAIQEPDGSWLHRTPLSHTFPLPPPWASAITQGEGASLLVRLHAHSGDDELARAAVRALAPLYRPQDAGGVCGELGGSPWPEEYPTRPQSHVLNGSIFALWGMRDVAVGLGDGAAGERYERGLDVLAENLDRYDTGSWSLYSLYPHPILNRASSFYHDLHVNQLTALGQLSPRPQFEATRRRWAAYAASRYLRGKAFAWKVGFRLLVPRNRLLARRAPWTRAPAAS